MSHSIASSRKPRASGERPLTLEQQIEELRRQLQVKRNARAWSSGPVPLDEQPGTLRPLGPRFRDTLWGESGWSQLDTPFDADE